MFTHPREVCWFPPVCLSRWPDVIGDVQDFVRRLRAVLPRGWLGDIAPISDTVLSAFGAAWEIVFALIATLRSLSRIKTAYGPFLDMISTDFFAAGLVRQSGESDASFITRIGYELLRSRATRQAVDTALWQLTGRRPAIVEPARAIDTGSYNRGGVGYGVAGAWGSLLLSNACFVTAFRPHGVGIAELAGFGTGGPIVYGNLAMVATSVSDQSIYASIAKVLPLGCTAWVRISD